MEENGKEVKRTIVKAFVPFTPLKLPFHFLFTSL